MIIADGDMAGTSSAVITGFRRPHDLGSLPVPLLKRRNGYEGIDRTSKPMPEAPLSCPARPASDQARQVFPGSEVLGRGLLPRGIGVRLL